MLLTKYMIPRFTHTPHITTPSLPKTQKKKKKKVSYSQGLAQSCAFHVERKTAYIMNTIMKSLGPDNDKTKEKEKKGKVTEKRK